MTLIILALLAAVTAPQAGTAVIRGRVVDKETGQPIARAAVTVHIGTNTTRDVLTGADGRYEFTDLSPGQVLVSATAGDLKATHIRGFAQLPDRAPWGPLKEGEVRSGADIVLARGLAISGRVVGPSGEPLARVQVRVQRVDGRGGSFLRPRGTDDRGMFRLFDLEPGRYYVCAEGPAPAATFAFASAQSERYVGTCYPSAPDPSSAEPVAVTTTEVEAIEIVMRRSRVYTISGVALDATGRPLTSGMVGLERAQGSGSGTSFISAGSSGEFRFNGLPPGRYTVIAQPGGPFAPFEPREREVGFALVDVSASDVSGVTIALKRPVSVPGRVASESGIPLPPPSKDRGMEIVGRRDPTRPMGGVGFPSPASVRDDFTFELAGLLGPFRIEVMNPPPGWIVKSIRYRSKDILDAYVEFAAGSGELEVVLTDRGAVVSGTVTDDRAAPAAGARVVLFPADPAKWQDVSAYDMTARAAKDGRFTLGPRLAGDYLIVALSAQDEAPATLTRALFERMAKVAERITLLESDRRTIDLRSTTVPDRERP